MIIILLLLWIIMIVIYITKKEKKTQCLALTINYVQNLGYTVLYTIIYIVSSCVI